MNTDEQQNPVVATSETMNRRRKLQLRLLLIAFGLVVGLTIAEVTFAVLNIPHIYQPRTYPDQFFLINVPSNNGTPVYVNLPSAEIIFNYDGNPRGYFGSLNEVVHQTNSLGFRGNEFDLAPTENGFAGKKAEGITRIAFLGDSFTFGEGVHDDDVYPQQTATKLSNELGRRVEAYNFGVGGYNTTQSLFVLQHMAVETFPDIVVLGYVLNDAEPPIIQLDSATGAPYRVQRFTDKLESDRKPKGLLRWSRTLQLITDASKNKQKNERTELYYQSIFEERSRGWQASRAALTEIVRICSDRKIPCVIVLFPLLQKLDQYPYEMIHQLIAETVDKAARRFDYQSVSFIDLLEPVKNAKLSEHDLWVHPTDHHPNEIVHKIAASELSKTIDAILNR